MSLIYCLYNKKTTKTYVGQTGVGIQNRWKRHQWDSQKLKCQEYPLYRAIKKYGASSFDVIELGEAHSQEQTDNLEKLWIILLRADRHLNGYNIKEGGHRGKNSLETRLKISLANKGKLDGWPKGKKRSPENCAKMGLTKIGNKNCVGRVLSEETKAKIGAKSRGRKCSEETKQIISEKIRAIRATRYWASR